MQNDDDLFYAALNWESCCKQTDREIEAATLDYNASTDAALEVFVSRCKAARERRETAWKAYCASRRETYSKITG